MKQKGFTLIELLVVIAIIGILSSVVLASLSNARQQGQDVAVKSDMAQIGSQAELYYTTGNTYVGFWSTAASLNGGATLLSDIEAKNLTASSSLVASTTGYAISTLLPGGGYFCADAEGTVNSTTSVFSVGGGCR